MTRLMPFRGDTLSQGQVARVRTLDREPCLFLQVECDRPLAGPARYRLGGHDHVLLSRAEGRSARLEGEHPVIEIPDATISVEHADLQNANGQWVLTDRGSRNGTFVDGKRIEKAVLADRALIRVGRTFLRFHTSFEVDGPAALDFAGLSPGRTGLLTLSPAFGLALKRAEAVAGTRVPVLLRGESGTGKELLARAIHEMSGRRGAFVAVNAGAIPPNLVEGELFGYRKGAFTGADRDHPGLLRASEGGTLFLDEIGDLPTAAQAALLRVLQESEVLQVGSTRPQPLDLRVVAATHRDLEQLVASRVFRHDLLARIDGLTLVIPPLRRRVEDVPLLITVLLARLALAQQGVRLSPEAAEALLSYDWPLNVRQLEQALASAVALAGGGPIEVEHLPRGITGPPVELDQEQEDHRQELVALLREHHGNLSAVARVLGKGRTQVVRWIERYRLDLGLFRGD